MYCETDARQASQPGPDMEAIPVYRYIIRCNCVVHSRLSTKFADLPKLCRTNLVAREVICLLVGRAPLLFC